MYIVYKLVVYTIIALFWKSTIETVEQVTLDTSNFQMTRIEIHRVKKGSARIFEMK